MLCVQRHTYVGVGTHTGAGEGEGAHAQGAEGRVLFFRERAAA